MSRARNPDTRASGLESGETSDPTDKGPFAKLSWIGGNVPVSRTYSESYYSIGGGLGETRHVFLAGNRLPERFRSGFHIAEIGFGTGLNLLAAWKAWVDSGQTGALLYTGFEAFPVEPDDMKRAHAAWPELAEYAEQLIRASQAGQSRILTDSLKARILPGDARQTVQNWTGAADAWFLDGFSPARNPELWEPRLLQAVAARTRPGGTFATYSAAGRVRRSLKAAGFSVIRLPGYGRKRHMIRGWLDPVARNAQASRPAVSPETLDRNDLA